MASGSVLQEPGRKPSAIVDAVIDASDETAGEVLVVTAALEAAFQSTGVVLTSPTIQGTVGAGTGLTMPAFTAGGDITLGANKLKTTSLLLKELDANTLAVRNLADSAYKKLYVSLLTAASGVSLLADGAGIAAYNSDGAYAAFTARDTGVDAVEVARLQGAADPYFQATLPMRILPVATTALPATPVEGMLAYDVTAHKLKVYVAAAWETIVSA